MARKTDRDLITGVFPARRWMHLSAGRRNAYFFPPSATISSDLTLIVSPSTVPVTLT